MSSNDRRVHSKCNLPMHGEIRGWCTATYEITPSYLNFPTRDLFICPYYENNIIKLITQIKICYSYNKNLLLLKLLLK